MGKRKCSEDSEAIKRKIKKLQRKLKKKEEDGRGAPPAPPPPPSPPPLPPAESRSPSPVEIDILQDPVHTAEPDIQIEIPDEDVLPSEFLEALGSEGVCLEEVGQPIHQQLASRWANIVTEGLSKEATTTIMKKYPTPSNFKQAVAPEINPEMLATLSEPSLKRDMRIIARQNMLGKTLTCIGQVLTNVMTGNINSKDIIEKLSDAAKITAETFYEDSNSRRFFALAGKTATVKEALKNAKTDGTLFGSDCAEKIRAAQAMQKTAAQIKENEKYKTHTKGNWKSPLPQQHRSGQQNRQQTAPRARQRPTPRARQQLAPRTRQQTAPRARQHRPRSPPQHRYYRR